MNNVLSQVKIFTNDHENHKEIKLKPQNLFIFHFFTKTSMKLNLINYLINLIT